MFWALVSLAASAISSGIGGIASYQQGKSQKNYYKALAHQSAMEAEYEQKKKMQQQKAIGDVTKEKLKRFEAQSQKGAATQRAALAAMGITGSTPEEVVSDFWTNRRIDENAIRYNADTDIWETEQVDNLNTWKLKEESKLHQFSAKNATKQGNMGAIAEGFKFVSSVAGGASSLSKGLPKGSGNPYGNYASTTSKSGYTGSTKGLKAVKIY